MVGVYSLNTIKIKSLLSLSVGISANRQIRSITLWQWYLLCSVSMYKILRLFSGRQAEYWSTSSFFNAAATIAEILKVFLLLALPVDALKFPSVPIVEPFTQSISGGTS